MGSVEGLGEKHRDEFSVRCALPSPPLPPSLPSPPHPSEEVAGGFRTEMVSMYRTIHVLLPEHVALAAASLKCIQALHASSARARLTGFCFAC